MASSRLRLRQVLAGMTGILVVRAGQGPRRKPGDLPGRVVNFGGWSGAARARAGGHGPGATLHDIVGEVGPDGSSHDSGQAVIGQQTAGRHVLRVEEFLPCPMESVWRVLTDPDLIARWLMPNEFRLEAGHRFAIDSDPIRRCGLGGTGHCEVLAFDEGKMLRIAWRAAHENMSGLDSTVTFTVAPEGVGTRLLIEHEGLHPCPYVITGIGCGPRGCRTSTRRIGEVPATAGAWRASIRRISEALAGDAADREG